MPTTEAQNSRRHAVTSAARQEDAALAAALFLDVVPYGMRELRRLVCPKGEIKSTSLGLSLPQLRILASLADSPAGTNSLAEGLGVSPPAVSRMLNLLEKKGYVERVQGLRDKRESRARLTAKGQECFASMQKEAQGKLCETLGIFSPTDLKALSSSLQNLRSLLRRLPGIQ